MASRGKRKNSLSRQPDLEAIGLALVALGIFALGVLLPSLPTGELGSRIRSLGLERFGWATYTLPWPLLILGGLFLLRRNPPNWPRIFSGYLALSAGLWSVTVLTLPGTTGAWGAGLRAVLTGAAGALAYLPTFLLVTIGLDLIVGWVPTRIARTLLVRLFLGVRKALRVALEIRGRAKAHATFHADVALVRGALRDLDQDLIALGGLYPGSAELDRWRKAVQRTLGRLGNAGSEQFKEAQADLDAWKSAVCHFARDRVGEMVHQFRAEGVSDFETWVRRLKAQLEDPFADPLRLARPLDSLRKALALDLTALTERHRRLTRECDSARAALTEMPLRALARAFADHSKRLEQFQRIVSDADDLEADAGVLEPWRELSGKLLRLSGEFADAEEIRDLDDRLALRLQEKGRAALSRLDEAYRDLESIELIVRGAANTPGASESIGGRSLTNFSTAFDTFLDGVEEDEVMFPTPIPTATETPASHAAATGPEDPAVADAEVSAVKMTAEGLFTPVPEAAMPLSEQLAGEEPELTVLGSDVGGIPIQLPELDLLDPMSDPDEDPAMLAREVQIQMQKIDATLANFKLQGRVVASVRGPTVTRFEVEPAPGEKISRFANLSDDLALAMAVGSVRIEAPIPGKSVIGLEVPNANRDLIRFREAAGTGSFRRSKARLPLILGKSIDGEMVVADLVKMPHLLIAGSTGAGKSVAVNTLIGSLLYRFLPTELRFLMIDPKMVELTPYDGIPHLLRSVVTNPNAAADVLLGAVAHMERRYKMMSRIGAKNLDQYNEKARNLDLPGMPFIVIVIDELADLMITSPKEVESAIMRLAQMARATGMHLVLATQRPSVDILTSLIKVNVPARMAFAVSSGHDSRTILDTMGAERLIGMGDMLYYQPGLVKPVRLQGPFISEAEIGKLSSFMRRQYFDDDFVEAYGTDFDSPSLHEREGEGLIDWNDDKLRIAAELAITEGQASVSRLQRRLQVGHARAGKLMDSLEALGVVGAHVGSKPREVLVTLEELPNIFGK